MCRIAGIISTNTPTRDLVEKVSLMCRTMAHGGPDGEGIYRSDEHGLVLGHRRLAIIDLSEKGHQPMTDEAASVCITFNGEIYNYLELKAELITLGAKFNSDTDTEVIIQAYKHWGTASFDKLRGMFGLALFDSHEATTYLVRDRSGIKPIYYHISNGSLSFSSEIRAFKDAGITGEADEDWPIRFLAFGHIPEPYTTLKNVFSLPKGHYLSWHHYDHRSKIQRYTDANLKSGRTADPEIAQTAIRRELNDTIQRQMLAHAPLGVFLSGGIDSSLLTLLADKYKKDDLRTVSIFFDEQAFNEREYQNIVAERTTGQNFAHLVSQQDLEEALPTIINDMDMPTTDGINSWFISKYARLDGLKAVLSGIGADELFGGYPSFKRVKYLKYLRALPAPLLKVFGALSVGKLKRISLLANKHPLADYLFLRGLFNPDDIAAILNISKKKVQQVLFSDPIDTGDLQDKEKASWFETNLYMQNQLLRDTDVMSMAHGLEVRVPFLDEEFLQLVDSIAPEIRFNSDQPKKILIDTYPDLLPKEIWDRPKMGFSFPLQQWMRAHKQISDPELYTGPYTQKLVADFKKTDKVHWSKIFALYQLNRVPDNSYSVDRKKISLLSLQTFSGTGGIQKMTRTLAWVLQQLTVAKNWDLKLWSGYDHLKDLNPAYVKRSNFKGFNKNRAVFAAKAIAEGISADVVILTHINLAMVGLMIKLIKPKCKIWLIAHGVEVWRPLSKVKRSLLKRCDKVICVSDFTKQKMQELHGITVDKYVILNNALDPMIKLPTDFVRPRYLEQRYGIMPKNNVIFTLTRLASSEQYKGYEHVIEAVSLLTTQFPDIKYILSGKYDDAELARITDLINKFSVADHVILTGYIDEVELEDHFMLADVFALPSKKEGFGIVFIEALACGAPVICGNEDGSLDAIRNGELGVAINPDSVTELKDAIASILAKPLNATDRKALQDKCLKYFNADNYKNKIEELLADDQYQ